jgi:nickel-dependent lactate racemase
VLGVIAPKDVPIGDERETINQALDNPINSKPFREFISNSTDILFVVNDAI